LWSCFLVFHEETAPPSFMDRARSLANVGHGYVIGQPGLRIADPRILSWGTETETDFEYKHSIGLKRQYEGIKAKRKPAFGGRTLHLA